ncbi:MAG: acyltransferase [Betaproteobacteria bacterium]|nr:acyltransferase [Betaproteobacteria bacterium]
MAGTGGPAHAPAEFFPSIALIRAVAALLVVYDHFVGIWPARNGVAVPAGALLERWVFEPLHVMQHGGAFGVALFFMVSGFIIVHVAQRESRRTFAVRRALRIYPPLWTSMALLLAVFAIALAASDAPGLRGFQINDVLAQANPWPWVLAAATLGNYLIGTPAVNGVAWTLVIEVLFYATVLLLLPLLKARPRTAIVAAFAGLAALQAVARTHAFVFLLAVNGVYVTYLFLGSLVWLRWSGRVGNGFFVVATAAFWGLFVWGVAKLALQPPWTLSEYGVSYALAWLAFVGLLLCDRQIRVPRVPLFFSRISYSLYLNHGGLGMVALTLLYPHTGYPAALALTFAAVVAISAASYRWVELPSQRLARRLTARGVAAGG